MPAHRPAFSYNYTTADTYAITQTATCATGEITTGQVSGVVGAPTTPGVETPYKPHNLPTIVEAEGVDNGGEGVAYHDTTPGSEGGSYRPGEDVDITNRSDRGYAVSSIARGEWLNYTITNTGSTPLNPVVDFHISSTGVLEFNDLLPFLFNTI